ncbi:MAG: rod shape-determining protein MreC [Deltaproteobacteria bacterium]
MGFLLLSVLSPAVRPLTITILKAPLGLLRLVSREIGGMIFYHRNLVNNEKLRNRVDFLTYKINELSEIYLENARLRQLLALKEKAPYRVISARVIARSPDSWSSVIIIDKGSRNGIRRGLVAVNFLGLVGRVVETDEATSKVILISDPNLSVSALIQRSRQEGLVSGTLGTSLIMRYLPKDSDIKLYDTVITSGLTEIFPKGLLIGKVIDIGEEFSGLSRYAAIRPAANLSNLEEVLIIIP